jgi:hypothetical protein
MADERAEWLAAAMQGYDPSLNRYGGAVSTPAAPIPSGRSAPPTPARQLANAPMRSADTLFLAAVLAFLLLA